MIRELGSEKRLPLAPAHSKSEPAEAKEFGLIDEVVETRPNREDERGFRT